MAQLLYSKLSPYAAKARMALRHVGYEAEWVLTDTWNPPDAFLDANPLGKVPVLITDGGRAIHDSRVIVQFLDRWSGGRLFPAGAEARLAAEEMEALSDGICDCMQAIMSERRFRPEDKMHAPWTDRQWAKVARSLDRLELAPPDLPDSPHSGPHAGHIALRAMFGYLAIRFAGEWEGGHPRLTGWIARFDDAFPALAALAPQP